MVKSGLCTSLSGLVTESTHRSQLSALLMCHSLNGLAAAEVFPVSERDFAKKHIFKSTAPKLALSASLHSECFCCQTVFHTDDYKLMHLAPDLVGPNHRTHSPAHAGTRSN